MTNVSSARALLKRAELSMTSSALGRGCVWGTDEVIAVAVAYRPQLEKRCDYEIVVEMREVDVE